MTLRIIRPSWPDNDLAAAAAMIVSSNITETVPLYNSGTAYTVGQRVRMDTTRQIYEALAASTNKQPDLNMTGTGAVWGKVGASNRFALLDAVNSTVTTQAEMIDITLSPGKFDSLYLGGLSAKSVDVYVSVDGVVLRERHYPLLVDNVFSWSEWLNEPIIRETDLVVSDLAGYGNATVRVVINQPGNVAACGTLVVGRSRVLGRVQWNAGARHKSNSSFKDNGFGAVELLKRRAVRKIQAQIFAPNALFDEVSRLMAEYDGTNLLWSFSEEFKTLNVFGYKDDFDATLSSAAGFFYNLQVIELI